MLCDFRFLCNNQNITTAYAGKEGITMDMMETILRRKSVRSYTGEKISSEELQTILKAAGTSPVGMGAFDTLEID